MTLSGMKIITLIASGFEDLEFYVPLMRLQEENAEVIIAGLDAGENIQGKNGLFARAQVSIADLNPKDYDALLIPGGWAPDKLRRYDVVKNLVREMDQDNKIIGMICHAGLVGISAGIVKAHRATGSEGIKDDLINAGAIWQNLPAFRSGNLIWGRVVADIPQYCHELVTALREQNLRTKR